MLTLVMFLSWQSALSAIDDPLLMPVPAPGRVVDSWADARAMLDDNSVDLQRAVVEVRRAEARATQALASLLPTARAQGGLAYDIVNPKAPALGVIGAGGAIIAIAQGAVTPTIPSGGGAISLNVPIVDVGAWSGLGAADDGVAAAQLSIEDARRRVTQSLSNSLVAVVAAERASELNREGLRQGLERQAMVDKQNALGAASRLDVVRTTQDVELARATIVSGNEQLLRAREALGVLLGGDGPIGVSPTFSLDGLVHDATTQCQAHDDVSARGDMRAARARSDAAHKLTTQALLGYLPRLDVTSSAAALTANPGPLAIGTWSIGAVISVPIWEGGLREGLVREREANADGIDVDVDALSRAVRVEVSQAVRWEGTTKALHTTALAARDLAREADDLTKKAFTLGRVSSLEVVQTAQALRLAELTLALREFEWASARINALLVLSRCDA